jgi:ATP-binding cassette, subfamily G (WHITE), member 2, SNQ2
MSRKEFDQEVQNLLLRMLNISHTRNTLVGDEFVRGVSGGERKRVSIAEMMATRARVQSWDNSTRGLDASNALDFVRCLRILTDVLGQTTFVSLYQAGEGIYELFDKVLVLNEGRQVYFGPPSEARLYFEVLGYRSLPRQSTPDYLTGCTDPNERQFTPDRSEKNVPSTPEELEQAFLTSVFARDNEKERQKYELYNSTERADQEAFRAAVADDKKKGVSKKSPYTLGYFGQVKALTKRQFSQRLQDRFQLYTSLALAWILALTIGGAYFKQPLLSQGAFTRAGLMFVTMLTICTDAFGEVRKHLSVLRTVLTTLTDVSSNERPLHSEKAGWISSLQPFCNSIGKYPSRHPIQRHSYFRDQCHHLLHVRSLPKCRRAFHLPYHDLYRLPCSSRAIQNVWFAV